MLQCVAVCCEVLQCVVVYFKWVFQRDQHAAHWGVAVCCVTMWCSVFLKDSQKCVVMRCSVLQCAVLCFSV